MYEILNISSCINWLMPYVTGSGSLKASRWVWPKSGSTGVEFPFDHGPALWISASFQNLEILESCVRGWWKMWKLTTATTPSSSWVSSSTACKAWNKFDLTWKYFHQLLLLTTLMQPGPVVHAGTVFSKVVTDWPLNILQKGYSASDTYNMIFKV